MVPKLLIKIRGNEFNPLETYGERHAKFVAIRERGDDLHLSERLQDLTAPLLKTLMGLIFTVTIPTIFISKVTSCRLF